jgi:uncharacterized protein YutE (UPF0331/DUF86 family)
LKFDENRITKLSSEILNAINGLQEISELSKEEFLENHHMIASAKYHLVVSIEAVIDLSNYLIRQNKLRIPENYADTFKVLAESNVIEEDLSRRLMEMAKFRNRLVHIYWEVDDEVVYSIIKEDIKDVEEFLASYTEFLRKKD